MPYETDERLKGYLDASQLQREQLCQAVLASDGRFSNVQPRQPRGGSDGGRDLQAQMSETLIYGAVGFINQANDSSSHRNRAARKFRQDLQSAMAADPRPGGFVFFTNVNFTHSQRANLIRAALAEGLLFADIFDRERIRIALDAPDGLATRFQILGLPLSEAEQASFFAKWGADIQSVISRGFSRIDLALERITFLEEARDILVSVNVLLRLSRTYSSDEIGHFRAFISLALKEWRLGIVRVMFGAADGSDRFSGRSRKSAGGGIASAMSTGQWERHLRKTESAETAEGEEGDAGQEGVKLYRMTQRGSSIGRAEVSQLYLHYTHDHPLFRNEPRLTVRDLEGTMFLPVVSRNLAEKIEGLSVFANGYKIGEYSKADIQIDPSPCDSALSEYFSEQELADPWVRIRPTGSSAFTVDFATRTPVRMYEAEAIPRDPE